MKAIVVVAAVVTICSTPALAVGALVNNGGFETGDFSGWSLLGDNAATSVYDGSIGLPVDDGIYSAAFGQISGYGTLSQTIDTVPGKSYDVSFDLGNTDVTAVNQMFFSFDDGFQFELDTLPPFGFSNVELPVTASGITADVSFFFYNPTGLFLLDDVVVTPVPEPTSWCLMLAGFAAIGAAMRGCQTTRRRQLLAA